MAKLQNSLSRSQSPLDQPRSDPASSDSVSFSKLRDVPSKYLQFLLNPTPVRKLPTNTSYEEVPLSLASVSIQNDQLRQAEVPNARVVIARSAGAFRSAIKSKEPQCDLRPTTGLERRGLRISRIHSTLCVGKKVMWEAGRLGQAKRAELRSDGDRSVQAEAGRKKGHLSFFHPLKTVS